MAVRASLRDEGAEGRTASLIDIRTLLVRVHGRIVLATCRRLCETISLLRECVRVHWDLGVVWCMGPGDQAVSFCVRY
jgi:hypothetical protein